MIDTVSVEGTRAHRIKLDQFSRITLFKYSRNYYYAYMEKIECNKVHTHHNNYYEIYKS